LDLAEIDFNHVVADMEEVRRYNPQRYEMEQLTAIVFDDYKRMICAGYKDITDHEFWVRGHMPGFPLMPGVLMCEAAAQLSSYFYSNQKIGEPGVLLGLGGLDETRFLRQVRPGERLVMVGTGVKVHRRMTKIRVVGTVAGACLRLRVDPGLATVALLVSPD
jgi:3-hydroxyacyl-[acyl-carrier-protein] dehydratase